MAFQSEVRFTGKARNLAIVIAVMLLPAVLIVCVYESDGHSIIAATPIDPSTIPPHQVIEAPENQFTSIAWLDENTLIVTSNKITTEQVHNEGDIPRKVTVVHPQIESIDLRTSEFTSLEPVTRTNLEMHNCRAFGEFLVRRVAPRSILFRHRCVYEDISPPSSKVSVMYLDFDDPASLSFVQEFPKSKAVHSYSMEPGGERLAAVVRGYFLSNELYVFTPDPRSEVDLESPNVVRLLSDYMALRDVHWTSRGIVATVSGKGLKRDASLEAILDAKSDLVLVDPDTGEYSVLVQGMEEAYAVRWSPDESVLAFSGIVNGVDGAWLYDPESEELTLLWPEVSRFDWSPSGDRLALLHIPNLFGTSKEIFEPDTSAPNYPVIINVPR